MENGGNVARIVRLGMASRMSPKSGHTPLFTHEGAPDPRTSGRAGSRREGACNIPPFRRRYRHEG